MEDKIRKIIKRTGWTQTEVANRLDTTQATVSRWLTGSDPKGFQHLAINTLYQQIIDQTPSERDDADVHETELPVMGYLGAGAEIQPDFEQVPPEGLYQITLPFRIPEDMIAFEVRGDSMLPVYKNGSVVVVFKEQKRPLEHFYGEEAAVRTADGRRFIKMIQRGQDGRVNLFSFNAPMIEDVHLEWIGEIFTVMPRSQLRRVERQGGIQGRLSLSASG